MRINEMSESLRIRSWNGASSRGEQCYSKTKTKMNKFHENFKMELWKMWTDFINQNKWIKWMLSKILSTQTERSWTMLSNMELKLLAFICVSPLYSFDSKTLDFTNKQSALEISFLNKHNLRQPVSWMSSVGRSVGLSVWFGLAT